MAGVPICMHSIGFALILQTSPIPGTRPALALHDVGGQRAGRPFVCRVAFLCFWREEYEMGARRRVLAVSVLGGAVLGASLLGLPRTTIGSAPDEASLEKQIQALQAGLDALKAELARRAERAEVRETPGRGPERPAAGTFGRGPRGMMGRGMRGPGPFGPGGGGFIDRFDRDGNGKITAEEFPRGKEAFGHLLGLADKDGDGTLDRSEFSELRQGQGMRRSGLGEARSPGTPNGPKDGCPGSAGCRRGFGQMRGLGHRAHGPMGGAAGFGRPYGPTFGPGAMMGSRCGRGQFGSPGGGPRGPQARRGRMGGFGRRPRAGMGGGPGSGRAYGPPFGPPAMMRLHRGFGGPWGPGLWYGGPMGRGLGPRG